MVRNACAATATASNEREAGETRRLSQRLEKRMADQANQPNVNRTKRLRRRRNVDQDDENSQPFAHFENSRASSDDHSRIPHSVGLKQDQQHNMSICFSAADPHSKRAAPRSRKRRTIPESDTSADTSQQSRRQKISDSDIQIQPQLDLVTPTNPTCHALKKPPLPAPSQDNQVEARMPLQISPSSKPARHSAMRRRLLNHQHGQVRRHTPKRTPKQATSGDSFDHTMKECTNLFTPRVMKNDLKFPPIIVSSPSSFRPRRSPNRMRNKSMRRKQDVGSHGHGPEDDEISDAEDQRRQREKRRSSTKIPDGSALGIMSSSTTCTKPSSKPNSYTAGETQPEAELEQSEPMQGPEHVNAPNYGDNHNALNTTSIENDSTCNASSPGHTIMMSCGELEPASAQHASDDDARSSNSCDRRRPCHSVLRSSLLLNGANAGSGNELSSPEPLYNSFDMVVELRDKLVSEAACGSDPIDIEQLTVLISQHPARQFVVDSSEKERGSVSMRNVNGTPGASADCVQSESNSQHSCDKRSSVLNSDTVHHSNAMENIGCGVDRTGDALHESLLNPPLGSDNRSRRLNFDAARCSASLDPITAVSDGSDTDRCSAHIVIESDNLLERFDRHPTPRHLGLVSISQEGQNFQHFHMKTDFSEGNPDACPEGIDARLLSLHMASPELPRLNEMEPIPDDSPDSDASQELSPVLDTGNYGRSLQQSDEGPEECCLMGTSEGPSLAESTPELQLATGLLGITEVPGFDESTHSQPELLQVRDRMDTISEDVVNSESATLQPDLHQRKRAAESLDLAVVSKLYLSDGAKDNASISDGKDSASASLVQSTQKKQTSAVAEDAAERSAENGVEELSDEAKSMSSSRIDADQNTEIGEPLPDDTKGVSSSRTGDPSNTMVADAERKTESVEPLPDGTKDVPSSRTGAKSSTVVAEAERSIEIVEPLPDGTKDVPSSRTGAKWDTFLADAERNIEIVKPLPDGTKDVPSSRAGAKWGTVVADAERNTETEVRELSDDTKDVSSRTGAKSSTVVADATAAECSAEIEARGGMSSNLAKDGDSKKDDVQYTPLANNFEMQYLISSRERLDATASLGQEDPPADGDAGATGIDRTESRCEIADCEYVRVIESIATGDRDPPTLSEKIVNTPNRDDPDDNDNAENSKEFPDSTRSAQKSPSITKSLASTTEHSTEEETLSSAPEVLNASFPELDDRYVVFERISQGTFSEVYLAGLGCDPSRVVALKRIYTTSAPGRVANEVRALRLLGGQHHVSPLLAGHHSDEFNTLVLPYLPHESFRTYFSQLTVEELRDYLRALLRALAHVHAHSIIHRDIKPSNFLFSRQFQEFMLVDFGLCEQYKPPQTARTKPKPVSSNRARALSSRVNRSRPSLVPRSGVSSSAAGLPSWSLSGNKRRRPSTFRAAKPEQSHLPAAARAGTRGFRAPEVLLRCRHQTPAIDIWSVGSILLSILSGRFPFFWSPDDMTALVELAHIYGSNRLRDTARHLRRKLCLPVEAPPLELMSFCKSSAGPDGAVWPDEVYHLLERLLEPLPDRRISAVEALAHPFLSQLPQ